MRIRGVELGRATTGFIVNYTLEHAVRPDLEGAPVETLTCAHHPGEVTLYLKGSGPF